MELEGRECVQCGAWKLRENFSWKGKDHKRLAARCHDCRKKNHKENPESNRERARAYHSKNREAILQKMRLSRASNLPEKLVIAARKRAKAKGLPFDICCDDVIVPSVCPVLGLKLEVNRGRCRANSPTLDRIIPSLGYVKGNVVVISHRANTIKSDATMVEIASVLAFYGPTYGVKSHAWAALAVAVTASETLP